ncbi:sigma-70 family RNA polymerase sigma factor [Reinekea sp. G2M2-21]|uniref:sigma-70 family RNA polymerase sigma factor n=1 Tax=Reinekea sp. G2M2-21 TaxID=2788942 RepID=UPI0018ABBF7E|nr:sigma-70 family RNA polymerase sigma factor [Reinekea sp. G2M2-21]
MSGTVTKAEFETVVATMRSKLHRYCARMTGSVIDGEDVLQTALIKAYEAVLKETHINNIEAWLFQVAHNTAMDFFRKRNSQETLVKEVAMQPDENSVDTNLLTENIRQLSVLPPLQRSVVLLRDLFGYPAEEVAEILMSTTSAVKSALHRGRQQLKKVSVLDSAVAPLPAANTHLVDLIRQYVDLFNQRKFDDIQDLLTEEVRLDMVNKVQFSGKAEVGGYFINYSNQADWRMEAGVVEGRPAVLAFTRESGEIPAYFVLLEFDQDALRFIRDFRYAQYVMEGATWQKLA